MLITNFVTIKIKAHKGSVHSRCGRAPVLGSVPAQNDRCCVHFALSDGDLTAPARPHRIDRENIEKS